MKARLRIPTKTQFAFIEAEVEGTPHEIVGNYNELSKTYWEQGAGLGEKEWRDAFDKYVWTQEPLNPQQFEGLSETQKMILREIDNSRNRKFYKELTNEA